MQDIANKGEKIELGVDKLVQGNLEHVVGKTLGIDYGGSAMDNYARVRAQLRERIAGHVIVVNELDMLMHGEELLEVVQLCYDYRAALEIRGDAKNVTDHLVNLMMSDRKMSRSIATAAVDQLFPDGTFLYNPKPSEA